METSNQQSTAFGVVPTTPTTIQGGQIPGVPPQAADPTEKTRQMLAALIQAAQRKQLNPQVSPAPVPGMQDPRAAQQIGMNTGNPHAWGFQRFAGELSTNIKNAVAKQKQDQLAKAEGDWSYLQSSMNELYSAQQSGDQQAAKAAQVKVDAILGDPKKLKNMAKALNQDWLNPEKTTVYGEALKKVGAQVKQKEQQEGKKQQAAEGLKGMIKKLLGQKQQLQLTVDEQKRMSEEIQRKAPTITTGPDKETMLAMRDQMKAEEKAAEEERKEAARVKEQTQKKADEVEILEFKDKLKAKNDQMQHQFSERMERMREQSSSERQQAHDWAMLKATGMKIDAQMEKLFKPNAQKIDKELGSAITDFHRQLSQAQQNLRTITNASSGTVMKYITGPGKDDIKAAQDQVDNLERAIKHMEKNRDAVVKGKADYEDVINKAYDLMGGGEGDVAPPPPIPGATVTKKP